MTFFQEELLEPPARIIRFLAGVWYMPKKKSIDLVDLGSGPELRFQNFAQKLGVTFSSYTAIDPLINHRCQKVSGLCLITSAIERKIALPSNKYDYVVTFASIEHMDHPREVLNESVRLLRRHSRLIVTTPTHRAKLLLETLAFKLKLLSKREVREHKNYFDKKKLLALVKANCCKIKVTHCYFEFGLNNLLVVEKL